MSRQLWTRGIWGIAVALATSAVAIAAPPPQQGGNPLLQQQQPQQQIQNQTFERAGANRPMAGHNLDHFLVRVLIKANKDEIEMGKLAEQRSNNVDVKQLATQMVQDHTRFLNQLEQFHGAGGINAQTGDQQQTQRGAAFRGITPDRQNQQPQQQQVQPGQQQPQNAQQPGNINQPGDSGQQGVAGQQGMRRERIMGEHGPAGQFAKIMEEVDRNMQQVLMRELSSKQGADFDRCYLTGQMFGHVWVAEALKTFEQHASPQLKPILQEGLQATEQHLTHIKSLLARNENEPRTSGGLRQRGARFNR